MIDKNVFIKVLIERAEKLPVGHYLDIRSYKRNRTVLVVREEHDSFLVIEDGFLKEEFRVSLAKLRKLFKVILKKEFPRSHKIRLYTMGKYNEKEAKTIKRKKNIILERATNDVELGCFRRERFHNFTISL